jgi:hypothetical protein
MRHNHRIVARFLNLPHAKQMLLIQVVALLGAIRLGVWLVPFGTIRRVLGRIARRGSLNSSAEEEATAIARVVQAVETAGRHCPAIATCLTQALAAHVLIGRAGYQSDLRIGITRDDRGKFVAHAWLENNGKVLIGDIGLSNYAPMPVLNGLDPRMSKPRN